MKTTLSDIRLAQWRQKIETHLLRVILPFWMHGTLDHEVGGFVGEIGDDHRARVDAPKGLILNTRLLWTFSALYHWDPWPEYQNLAQRAFYELIGKFWDPDYGGFWWAIHRSGSCLDDSKKTYGQAFALYALCEYARAFDKPLAWQRARQLYDLIEQHTYDDRYGGYLEVCRRDWTEARDHRLSEKDMDEKKSMNNHLHLLEAYTHFYHCQPDPQLKTRLLQLVDLFDQHIITPDRGHVGHFFTATWQPRSQSYTYGHDIEASWLLWEAVEALGGDEVLQARVRAMTLGLARGVLVEGVDDQGGLCYEGRDGHPIDRTREWWPQAEAVVGFLNAYQLTGDEAFFEAAFRVWRFIERFMVDHERGEWFWRVDAQGRPDRAAPKLSTWKAPYHNGRACLESMKRLTQLEQVESIT